jgi:hypothetical protein
MQWEMINMNNINPVFLRKPEEKEKFKHFIQTLVWVRQKTDKPSAEIISALLRKSNQVYYESCFR